MTKDNNWYKYVYKLPVDIFWLESLPKFMLHKQYNCPEVPKEILANYINKSILNMIYNNLDYKFHKEFYKKYGKKPLIEYIKNKIGIKTNPLTYKGEWEELVSDCLFCFLDVPDDDVEFINGCIYWQTSVSSDDNKNLKKAEMIDKYYIHYSHRVYDFVQKDVDKNLNEAYTKYMQLLKQIKTGVSMVQK